MIVVTLGTIAITLSVFSFELISAWLGPEFAEATSTVAIILAAGMVINGYAHVPYTYLQGLGRPKLPAVFHMIELAIYLPLLFALVREFGIAGAAYAWLIRVSIDAALLTSALNQVALKPKQAR